MARFQFGLEKVLSHRKVLEQLAERELNDVRAELAEEQKKLSDMESEKVSALVRRHQVETLGGNPAADLEQTNVFLGLQDVRIAKQKEVIKEVEGRVEKCADILREKAIDSKIMERLKDKKIEEFRLENRRLEQKLTDDVVATRVARQIGQKKE